MKVRVAYHGQLRLAAGAAGEELEVPAGSSVADVLQHAARRHGVLRSVLLGPNGQPSRAVLVAVGDRQVRPGESVALRDGDVVTLLPPIGGG